MYGYAITLLYECYMRNGTYLTKVNHPIDHSMTSNYTPDIFSCYPGYRTQELELCTPPVMHWSKDDDSCIDMLSHCFFSII